jgi:hypothetical protein
VRRFGTRLVAFAALAAFFAALLGIAISSALSGPSTHATSPKAPARKAKRPAPPPAPRKPPARKKPVPKVHLTAVATYDPEGDGHENDDLVPAATDGDPATFWSTEHYHSFFKSGVGLLLDAGRAVELPRLTLVTDTPGLAAEIRAASNPTGPFTRVSPVKTITGTTHIPLKMKSPGRYFLVWVVAVPTQPADIAGLAHVNEARAP